MTKNNYSKYKQLEKKMLKARFDEDEEAEDALLDEMDEVWWNMSDEDRERANSKFQVDIEYDGDRSVMTISYDGKVLFHEYDYGEPEDNSFYRDWSWIKDALLQAYELGRKDGKAELREWQEFKSWRER